MNLTAAAGLSMLSAVVVALIGHVLAEKRARRMELADLRLKAYSDFMQSASRIMVARRSGEAASNLEELATLNDAKVRICICGEPSVVKALLAFWESGGTLEREGEVLAFRDLCSEMRTSVGNKRVGLIDVDVSDVLFRLEPYSYSYRASKLGSAESSQQSAGADAAEPRGSA